MPAGWLNPYDAANTTGTRPAHTNTNAGERRWHQNDPTGTLDRAEDHNAVLAALRAVADYFGTTDAEGDDTLLRQAISKAVDRLELTETSVASAATADIGGAPTGKVLITGTTTITSFGVVADKTRIVRFADALVLTHNATSLILPGGVNIATAAGDSLFATSDASGNWRVLFYTRAAGGGSAWLDATSGVGAEPLDVVRHMDIGRAAYMSRRDIVGHQVSTVGAATTLTPADYGRLVIVTATATITLPSAAECDEAGYDDWWVELKARAAVTITLQRAGADTIDGAASITIAAGTGGKVRRTGATSFEAMI